MYIVILRYIKLYIENILYIYHTYGLGTSKKAAFQIKIFSNIKKTAPGTIFGCSNVAMYFSFRETARYL